MRRFSLGSPLVPSAAAGSVLCAALLLFAGCPSREETLAPPPPPDAQVSPALATHLADVKARRAREPGEPRHALELALLLHANRQWAEAEAVYASLDPADFAPGQVPYLRAELQLAQGQLERARVYLEQAQAAAPERLHVLLRLAEVLHKLGDADAARQHYEAVRQHDPGNVAALVALARDHQRRGSEVAARELLEQAAAAEPTSADALALLAQALTERGDVARAGELRKRLREAPLLWPHDPWLDALLQHDFDSQQLSIRFEELTRAGRTEAAREALDRLQQLDPQNPQPYVLRGRHHQQQQAFAAAETAYREALVKGADPELVYPELVKTLIELGRYDEAAQTAREGLERAPQTAALRTALGGLRLRARDLPGALAEFQAALALDPNHLFTHQVLARLYWETGDKEAGRRHLEALRRLDPGDAVARRNLGQYALEREDAEEALAPLEEAHRLEPADENGRYLLALALAQHADHQQRAGNRDAARAAFTRAHRLLEDHPAHDLRRQIQVDLEALR